MKPLFTMRQAVEDPNLLGSMVAGDSWRVWRTLLIASRGEPLTPQEMKLYQARTGRVQAPQEPVDEAAFIAGRRSGKTVAAACAATYLSALCDWSDALTRGERGVLLFLAQSQKTARVAFRYADALFADVPMFAKMVTNRTQDTISLETGIDLEIRPASFRGLRGMTSIGVIADELAFWYSDDSANPDTEILGAVRPSLATTGGPVLMISSPYAKRGELYDVYRRHYGPDGDPLIMVAQGASRDFNETLSQRVVDREIERDAERAVAEYLGQFRDDVSSYINRDAVLACIDDGVRERPPLKHFTYYGFVDPAGGSGGDSMTLAIAHKEAETVLLDAVREIKPPFSPEATVAEFSALLKSYRLSQVNGDKYGGDWPVESFQRHGIFYEQSAKAKSDLYRDFLPLVNSRAVALLQNDRLVNQTVSLERRTGRSGKDSIDHPPGGHDDVVNSVAGVVCLANDGFGYDPEWQRKWRDLKRDTRGIL